MKNGFFLLFRRRGGQYLLPVLFVYTVLVKEKVNRAEPPMEAASNTQNMKAEQEDKAKLRGMTKEASGGCLADPDGSMVGGHQWKVHGACFSVSSLFLSLSVFARSFCSSGSSTRYIAW
ncbi:uncharacterized protein TrAtP1_012216 [Trichoderma atroviride]|uniref:uncharacterized protein n=1 Tax=Hypocrea atroviridis TaxID=63577 RepID=UPI00331F67AC|nr:hypothetical protein TrAtP1_012216 [Trichoderma atroviride]